MDIYDVDDETRIVTSNGTLADNDAVGVKEPTRINEFEKTWKIKANTTKYSVGRAR